MAFAELVKRFRDFTIETTILPYHSLELQSRMQKIWKEEGAGVEGFDKLIWIKGSGILGDEFHMAFS